MIKNFSTLKVQNPFFLLQGFKIQQEINDIPRQVKLYHFCRSQPKVRHNPQLFGLSKKALELIGLDYSNVLDDQDTPKYLSGSKLILQSKPIAQNYCGHQFGSWARQLGDGRAHTLGSVKHNNRQYELQLKGSGLTPFSRQGDGNSVLSSALRQFLASQLMAGLNIPTTRAVSIVVTDELVKRDPFYNGKIRIEKAAIVMRMCQTFLRFGSLQTCKANSNMDTKNPLQNRKILLPLCDRAIHLFFKDIDYEQQDPYEQFFKRLVKSTAQLVANWQSIGFCHGVLNTDNMSLGGITIDYGPYAFIDYFSKDFVSNASDEHQKYSFRQQSHVVKWNLQKLAEALDPVFPYSISMKYLNANFDKFYNQKYYNLFSNKLGIEENQQNRALIDELLENMHLCGTHFTNFFKIVQDYSKGNMSIQEFESNIVGQSEPTEFYLNNLRVFPQLLNVDISQILSQDTVFNRYFIQQQGKRIRIAEKLRYNDCKNRNIQQRQLWHKWVTKYTAARSKSEQKIIRNPKYVLLNYIAKQIIEEVEKSTPEESVKLLDQIIKVFQNPFEENQWFQQRYWRKHPIPIKLTCSS